MMKYLLLVLLALLASSAFAEAPAVIGPQEAFVDWTPVTQYTDGSTITVAVTYRLETQVPNSGGVWTTVSTVSNSSHLVTGLVAGAHAWRVITLAGGVSSDPSLVVTKTIAALVLKPKATTPISAQ